MKTVFSFAVVLAASVLGLPIFNRVVRAGQPSDSAKRGTDAPPGKAEIATFAGGCFWGIQDRFDKIHGVLNTTAGYTGGTLKNPTYREVCSHTTGHAEAVRVEFDPGVVTYAQLLDAFWQMHDPTEKNRQGPDVGDNYRSAIFFYGAEQKAAAEASLKEVNATRFHGKVATEIVPATEFYAAEEYHQHYFKKKGILYPVCH